MILAVLLAVLGLCAADAAGEESFILTGSDRAVWVIRSAANDKSFDVAVKEIGKDWRRIGKTRTGLPLIAAAVGDRLHVVFPSGEMIVFNLADLNGTPGASLKEPVAICESAGAFAKAKTPSAVAIVRGGARPSVASTRPVATSLSATTRSASRPGNHDGRDLPASGGQAGDHATQARLTNFTAMQYVDGQWREIAQLPALPFEPEGRVLPAVAGDVLYVFVAPGKGIPARLLAWKNGDWDEVKLPAPVAGEVPLAAVAIGGRLNLVLPARASGVLPGAGAGRRLLLIAALQDKTWQLPPQPITLNGKLKTAPQDRPPSVSRLGGNFALLWRDESSSRLEFAVCRPDGHMLPPNPVAVFAESPLDEIGKKILEYFLWGVLLAILVPMVLLRDRSESGPFILDEPFRPARLHRRALAMLIDFMPFSFLATAIFMPDVLSQEIRSWSELVEKFRAIQTEQVKTTWFAFHWITTMLLYVSYCIFMEARFGATLGKMLLKLRVVGSGGRRANLREVVVRNLFKFIVLHPWLGLLLPAVVFLMLLTRNHQRLGDLIARTAVVNAQQTPPKMPPTLQEPPSPPDADDDAPPASRP